MKRTAFTALDKIHKQIQWKEENNIRQWLIRIAGFVEERQKQLELAMNGITPELAGAPPYSQSAANGIPGDSSARSCGTPTS